ncbi:MAG TPA: alpha/beta fold hydrolase [Blastocatellia bacterium]|nr:alpha/beta fold hydrolase [Blastocatellia bacterium]
MKDMFRICFALLALAALAVVACAQEGPTRAEFECLSLNTSSGVALVTGNPSADSYHHVWTPVLTYGKFKSHGLELLYETQGNGSEVVIVLHGGPGLPHEYYHPMMSNLSRYAKVVYFDRRADMASQREPHRAVRVAEMADDVEALRQALGVERVTLLGHSFGTMIALDYALRYPDHTRRLILVSGAAMVENPAEAEKRLVGALSPVEMERYRSEGGTNNANPCERVRRRYAVLYPHYFYKQIPYEFDRGFYTVYFDSLAKKLALADDGQQLDVRNRLAAIKAPVLVVAGRHDLITPVEQSFEMAKALPQSRFVVLEHSGHFPIFEENYLFTEWARQFMVGTAAASDRVMATAEAASSGGKR